MRVRGQPPCFLPHTPQVSIAVRLVSAMGARAVLDLDTQSVAHDPQRTFRQTDCWCKLHLHLSQCHGWVAARASCKSSCARVTRFCACVNANDVRHSSETLSSQARSAAPSADWAASNSDFASLICWLIAVHAPLTCWSSTPLEPGRSHSRSIDWAVWHRRTCIFKSPGVFAAAVRTEYRMMSSRHPEAQ